MGPLTVLAPVYHVGMVVCMNGVSMKGEKISITTTTIATSTS